MVRRILPIVCPFILMAIVFLGVTSLMEEVSGRTIIVDDDFEGEGEFISIQDAINASVDGDVIRVYNGTYNETLTVNVSVSIIGNGSEGVRINGLEDIDVMTIIANGTMIEGLYVRGDGDGYSIVISSAENELLDLDCRRPLMIEGSEGNVIDNFTGSIDLFSSNRNVIRHHTAYIDLIDSHYNTIEESNENNYGFITLLDSSFNTIQDNVLISRNYMWQKAQISLENSHNNQILNNLVLKYPDLFGSRYNDGIGIRLTGSDNNNLVNNTTFDHDGAIALISSRNATLQRNVMINDGLKISGGLVDHWASHSIENSNVLYDDYTSVRYRRLSYFANSHGESVPANSGQVILANCTNMTIVGQNCSDVSVGISLAFSSNNFISGNNCSSNSDQGIYILYSDHNRFIENICSDNWGPGMDIWYSSGNRIISNKFPENSNAHISARNSNSTVFRGNIFFKATIGLSIFESGDCIFEQNRISDCGYGISLDWFTDNAIIVDCEFIGNQIGVVIDESSNISISNSLFLKNTIGIELSGQERTVNSQARNNLFRGNDLAVNATKQFGSYWREYMIEEYPEYHYDERRFLDARYNEWGQDSGPYHRKENPEGGGDHISNYVLFDPWMDGSGKFVQLDNEEDPTLVLGLIWIVLCLSITLTIVVRKK
jgi:parallel beta-helix repeat protein